MIENQFTPCCFVPPEGSGETRICPSCGAVPCDIGHTAMTYGPIPEDSEFLYFFTSLKGGDGSIRLVSGAMHVSFQGKEISDVSTRFDLVAPPFEDSSDDQYEDGEGPLGAIMDNVFSGRIWTMPIPASPPICNGGAGDRDGEAPAVDGLLSAASEAKKAFAENEFWPPRD